MKVPFVMNTRIQVVPKKSALILDERMMQDVPMQVDASPTAISIANSLGSKLEPDIVPTSPQTELVPYSMSSTALTSGS